MYRTEDADNHCLPRLVSFEDHALRLLLIGHVFIYIFLLLYNFFFCSIRYGLRFSFLVLLCSPAGATTGARYIYWTKRDLFFFFVFFEWLKMGPGSRWQFHANRLVSCAFFLLYGVGRARSSHETNSFRISFHFCLLRLIPRESLISPGSMARAPYPKFLLIVLCVCCSLCLRA
jgi:hypothetical protein